MPLLYQIRGAPAVLQPKYRLLFKSFSFFQSLNRSSLPAVCVIKTNGLFILEVLTSRLSHEEFFLDWSFSNLPCDEGGPSLNWIFSKLSGKATFMFCVFFLLADDVLFLYKLLSCLATAASTLSLASLLKNAKTFYIPWELHDIQGI